MTKAYVDTSVLAAVVLDEPGGREILARLRRADGLYSSNLLEAELRSAAARESIPVEVLEPAFAAMNWILPDRPLTAEFGRILASGRLHGADLWHVACALYLSPRSADLSFFTLDRSQAEIARKVGFSVEALTPRA